VWYRRAADHGDSDAQANLSYMYESGTGVARDYDKAIQWARESAEHGNSQGQFNLAAAYGGGRGVPQDNVESYKWYLLSEAAGNKQATARLQDLAKRMSGEQVAEAQRRASDWAARHPRR